MRAKIIAMCTLTGCTVGCGTEAAGEGCVSDGQAALHDTSIQPEGWDHTALAALQALSLNTYAEGNATTAGQSEPITLDLQLDVGEDLVTFPGEATPDIGCQDWLVKSGTMVLAGAIEGSLPVTVTLRPEASLYEQLSIDDAGRALPGLVPPEGAADLLVTLQLLDDTWSGGVQWLLDDTLEGPFIELEVSAVL